MLVGAQSLASKRKGRSVSVWARDRKPSQFLEPFSKKIYATMKQEGGSMIEMVTSSMQDFRNSDSSCRLKKAKEELDFHLDRLSIRGL